MGMEETGNKKARKPFKVAGFMHFRGYAVLKYGAEEKTRTFTREPSLDPEPSASTNSATSAFENCSIMLRPLLSRQNELEFNF